VPSVDVAVDPRDWNWNGPTEHRGWGWSGSDLTAIPARIPSKSAAGAIIAHLPAD
jgi:hypothetical protein